MRQIRQGYWAYSIEATAVDPSVPWLIDFAFVPMFGMAVSVLSLFRPALETRSDLALPMFGDYDQARFSIAVGLDRPGH